MTKLMTILATLSLATAALAANPPDAYQVRYAANVQNTLAGDSIVNLTNAGSLAGTDPAGDICANVYVFAEKQSLIACCSCPLTPNHTKTLSVRSDLVTNTLTPYHPQSVTIGLVASQGTTCNASAVTVANLVSGLRAWGTTLHAMPGAGFALTETAFVPATLSASELQKMTSYCSFIQVDASGYGICGPCRTGASGAARQ